MSRERVSQLVAAAVLPFLFALPSPASAQSQEGEQFQQLWAQFARSTAQTDAAMTAPTNAKPISGAPPASPGGTLGSEKGQHPLGTRQGTRPQLAGTTCAREGRAKVCYTFRKGVLAKRCVTRRGRATCTYYRRGKATRRCTIRGSQRKCSALGRRSRLADGPPARAAALNWAGFPAQAITPVGKLVTTNPGSIGVCTATAVTRTLVLTAGHCLFDQSNGTFVEQVFFAPAMTPGDEADPASVNLPVGAWKATKWFVPTGYQNGDDSLDYGLVEFGPRSDGALVGDVVGSVQIRVGLDWRAVVKVYAVGYPNAGYWRTAKGRYGRAQFACDSGWAPPRRATGGGYQVAIQCVMNQGSSGGPWFVLLGDGSWSIGGVNSQCESPGPPACDPIAHDMFSPYIDNRMIEFYRSVESLRAHPGT